MTTTPGERELPLDVRRSTGSSGRDAALVEAVLDALASPTVLLDPDGRVVLANSAWTAAGVERRSPILPGADYHALALALRDDEDARRLVRELRELAAGERTEVSVDRSLPDPTGTATSWFHAKVRLWFAIRLRPDRSFISASLASSAISRHAVIALRAGTIRIEPTA